MLKNKVLRNVLVSLLCLCVCWGIGQITHRTDDDLKDFDSVIGEKHNQDIYFAVTYLNTSETDENPYGFTAGTIVYEDQEYSFLTPNTAAMIKGIEKDEISITLLLHPWVALNSDGAGGIIDIYDANENRVETCDFLLNGNDIQNKVFDLKKYVAPFYITINCNNGENDDDNSDWILVGCD